MSTLKKPFHSIAFFTQRLLLILLISLIGYAVQAQNFGWAITAGSFSQDMGNAMVQDGAGNLYIVGDFWHAPDFDPGPGVFTLTADRFSDVFIWKLTSNGDLVWAKKVGGLGEDFGKAIALDAYGDLVITGNFQNTVDFDPGPGVANLTANPNLDNDAFLLKLDTLGNFIWRKKLGGGGNDVVTDASGNIYQGGRIRGTADVDPGSGTLNLTSNGFSDILFCKYDTAGSLLWARQIGGNDGDQIEEIDLDNSGNLIFAGVTRHIVDLDPGPGVVMDTANINYTNMLVAKFDPAGNYMWSQSIRGDKGGAYPQVLQWDPLGNIYIGGNMNDTLDFDIGPGMAVLTESGLPFDTDAFVLKLDQNGDFEWVKQLANDESAYVFALAVDTKGNVYAGGRFDKTEDFDPGPGVFNLTPPSFDDAFVWQLDSLGELINAKVFGGGTFIDNPNDILVDSAGIIYTTGVFSYTVDFDPGPGTFNLTSNGNRECFVTKWDPCSITRTSSSVTVCDSITWTDGNTYYASVPGIQSNVLGANGCDSIHSVNLIVNQSTITTQTIDACSTYTWIDGNTYTSNTDSAFVSYTSPTGCDSTVFLNLTLHFPTSTVDVVQACGSYTWIDGNTYTVNNNSATHILTGAGGCDSVITLNLLLYSPTFGTDLVTACPGYTWMDGNAYFTNTNTPTHTLTNAAGCDSIVTLNLTLLNTSTGTDVISACDSYTWLDGNMYSSSNSSATHTLSNAAGCDSIVTLDLTILSSSTGTDVISACDSFMWIDGNTYFSNNNTATFTLPNAAGCDSVLTLDLTLDTVDTQVSVVMSTLTALASNATFQWLDCINGYTPIPGATNASYTSLVDGSFAIEVTQNGCTDTSDCFPIILQGTTSANDFPAIAIYPNPSGGTFWIKLDRVYPLLEITLVDVLGKPVDQQTYIETQLVKWEIQEPAGVYFIEIKTPVGSSRKKIVKW